MNDIANSRSQIEQRAKRFFAPNSVRTKEVHERIFTPLSQCGDVYVIGGALRDLAFFGADRRPTSDIDIVVTGSSSDVDRIARNLQATQNRFGGYGIKSGGMKVDFWAFENTWAKVHRQAEIKKVDDLLKSTFFDWDAILYNVFDKKIIAKPNYVDIMRGRVIEINLLSNPSPHGNLVRALRRLVMYDLRPGKRLKWFVNDGLRRYDWQRIVDTEKGAYHNSFLDQFESARDFSHRFFIWRELSTSGVQDRRQMEFRFPHSR